MKQNFSEGKDTMEVLEKKLQDMKKQYLKQEMSPQNIVALQKKMEEAKMKEKKEHSKKVFVRIGTAAAVLLAAFLILPNTSANIAYAMGQIPVLGKLVKVVTFRDYSYESERHNADIKVPEIVVEDLEQQNTDDMQSAAQNGNTDAAQISGEDQEVKEKLEKTTEEINAEIQQITNDLVEEFETYMVDEQGYQDIMVDSEVLATTDDYFTLKLLCYQGAGSGYQWNYYYTIDLKTGERLQLKDLFKEGADYITPISENIKQQMAEQMAADENVYYWLNDEIEECNFKTITDETSFYMNEKGNVVIGFNEGDVAPMYMGSVEFEIPAQVTQDIMK